MKNMHRFIRLGVTGTLIIILLIIPIMGVLTITTPPRISVDTKKFSVTPYYAPTTILPQNQTEIWINRTVKISEFLFIKIVDEINITNTKDRPFSAIIIYYPVKFWEKIRQIRILGAYRNDSFKLLNFMIYYRSAEYVGLLIKFYTLLDKYVSILKNTFRIKILFELREGLFEIKPFKDRMGLYLNMTPCPFLPYPIKSLVVNFISPEDVNLEFEFVKPESIRTMRKDGGGLIFLMISHEIAEKLELPFLADMFSKIDHSFPVLRELVPNDIPYDTKSSFSLYINHRNTFTGITDIDRSLTMRRFAELTKKIKNLDNGHAVRMLGQEFRSPGHIPICIAARNLLDERRGHTELIVSLLKMADLTPVGSGCEIMGDDGRALPKKLAQKYAEKNDLTFLSGKEILKAWKQWSQ